MYLLIHYFTIQNLEGIQMNAFMEWKDGVTDGRIIRQTKVFLRGTWGRGRMTVPVGENLETFASCILQRSKLILGCEGEMFWRVVDILHPVVLYHHVSLVGANAQQVTARLVRCVLPGLANQFIYNILCSSSAYSSCIVLWVGMRTRDSFALRKGC